MTQSEKLPRSQFEFRAVPNPHLVRQREILKTHPGVRELFGTNPWTALFALALVAAQLGLAAWLPHTRWWLLLLFSYFVGGTINHSLYVVLHECTHNLVFKRPVYNRILALIVNFPQVFPSAMQFIKYHMLHHTNQAEYDFDADLAARPEATWVGNSRAKKALWLFIFSMIQGMVRPSRLKQVKFVDGWFLLNIVTQLGFLVGFWFLAGGRGLGGPALLYLFFSTIFALGLHPMGGRWIQEHYLMRPEQETNSYYGPLNKLCFNMGYHNEHHDFMKVPWSRLPQVRASASEYYDNLFYWTSWLACLKRFILDRQASFFDRIVRPDQKGAQ
jgi:sphingolipid delta-4 desaturase